MPCATGGDGANPSTQTQVDAKIGRGQDFDGNNDFIESTPSLLNGIAALSMTMWVNLRSDDNTTRPGLAGQNNVLEMGFFWNDHINIWSSNMTTDCPGKAIVSLCIPDYTLNNWIYVAVSWDDA